jgi:hypothetical protein
MGGAGEAETTRRVRWWVEITRGAVVAALATALSVMPIGGERVVGGSAEPVRTPGERGTWLLLSARVRRSTLVDWALGRDGEAAAAAGDATVDAWSAVRAYVQYVPIVTTASGSLVVGDAITDVAGGRARVVRDGVVLEIGLPEPLPTVRFGPLPPAPVQVDTGEVSGDSLGLLVALAQLDAITFGDLTGGQAVAVTGTIDSDGAVGPVAALTAKVGAAVRNGSELIVAPRANADDLDAALVGVAVRVRTPGSLADAVDQLCALGATASVCESET